MATDATPTPASATATATPAPAAAEATQSQPAVPGAQTATPAPLAPPPAPDLKGMSKDALRDRIVASIAAKKEGLAKPAEATPAKEPPPAEAVQPEPGKEPPTEPDKPKPEDDKDLAAAKLLNETAQASQRARQRQKDAEARERRAAESEQRAQAELARLQDEQNRRDAAIAKAMQAGNELELLRAIGIPEERLRGDFFISALAQMDEPGQPQPQQPAQKALTAEEIKEIVRQEREAAIKEATEKQKAAGEQSLREAQAHYFGAVEQEFVKAVKSGELPLVRAIKPTMGELNDYLLRHQRETGVALPPADLLRHFEERYRAVGVTIAAPPAPKRAPSTAAPVRTISQAATSDAGTVSPPEEKPKERRSASDIRKEGFEKWAASRGRRVAG
jgi:hypothetical protein